MKVQLRSFFLVAILLLVMVLPASADTQALVKVRILDFRYRPRLVTMTLGDTVGWMNFGAQPHTVTSTGVFDSGTLNNGDTFMWTPSATGTYDYFCEFHPNMTARIVVN